MLIDEKNVKFEQELITPEKAQKFLANNKGNRQISRRHIDFLREQMISGKWKFTGDMIKISDTGRLLDGQHRLQAIVQSNTPQIMLIGYGFNEDIFGTIDTGKNRTAADLIAINGFTNAKNMQSMARFVLSFNKGAYTLPNSRSSTAMTKISNQEILDFVQNNEEMVDIIKFAGEIYYKIRSISHANLAGLYMLMAKKNQVECDYFFEKYGSGLDLHSKHPIYLLREKLLKFSMSKRKMESREKIALFIKAWNAFLLKKDVGMLTFKTDEAFPAIL